MPLIYGEGKEHALKRLREIINERLTGKHTTPVERKFPFALMLALISKLALDNDLIR